MGSLLDSKERPARGPLQRPPPTLGVAVSLTALRHRSPIKFDKRIALQCGLNNRKVALEQIAQVTRGDVPGPDQEQLPGTRLKKMRVEEIGVPRYDNSLLE